MNTILHLMRESLHHGIDDDHRRHAEHHADDRCQRDVSRAKIAPAENKFVHEARPWAVLLQQYFARAHSGRRSGNKITSRIDCVFVSSMISRSMQSPSPPAGGMP